MRQQGAQARQGGGLWSRQGLGVHADRAQGAQQHRQAGGLGLAVTVAFADVGFAFGPFGFGEITVSGIGAVAQVFPVGHRLPPREGRRGRAHEAQFQRDGHTDGEEAAELR